ncbi:hypothetical protein OA824_18580 [Citrobacter portucalensis]|nr:hypothetical protein [Citrobacter portucalensis]MDN4385665.1 hypothetical protein [Citrobacter portucalensis]MDN4406206.1 hypothetical protein [Citrobacter portucalensis]MDN4445599.1 hypothetical protein [Citrobacter portucalensis]
MSQHSIGLSYRWPCRQNGIHRFTDTRQIMRSPVNPVMRLNLTIDIERSRHYASSNGKN